jgi:hypothetical protein
LLKLQFQGSKSFAFQFTVGKVQISCCLHHKSIWNFRLSQQDCRKLDRKKLFRVSIVLLLFLNQEVFTTRINFANALVFILWHWQSFFCSFQFHQQNYTQLTISNNSKICSTHTLYALRCTPVGSVNVSFCAITMPVECWWNWTWSTEHYYNSLKM